MNTLLPHLFRRAAVATACAACLSLAQAAPPTQVVVVGSMANPPAGAMRVASLQAVPWASLLPGAQVLIGPGRHATPFMVNARGTAEQPIQVKAADPAQPPTLAVAVDFQGAAHVKLSGVIVDGAQWGAVVIRRGSHHITVRGNTLRKAYMGVDISDGAGTGHRIIRNTIEDHQTHGIAIVEVNADPADKTVVADNIVRRNGHHGLEIHGSNYVIEGNTVSDSGLTLGGTSGIHLYSRELDGYCDDNVVRHNLSFNNHDRSMYDGNGIQVDHWCDRNEVSHNVVWGNDGAGIIVFDGADNRIIGNTTYNNGLDPKRASWQLGEIIVSSQGAHVNRSARNQVLDNLMVPLRAEVRGVLVDYWSEAQPNTLGPNHYAPRPLGSVLLQRGGRLADTPAEVDAITATTGNLVETPSFQDVAQPMAHGLQLVRTPALPGQPLTGQRDMLGRSAARQGSYFGAYFTAQGL